jgi:predicted Rossmann-fold nucleotide-binding protein
MHELRRCRYPYFPGRRLEVLSKAEVAKLLDTSQGGLYQVFRKCALAVLNSGSSIDDGKELLERYKDFDISIIQRERGIKLDIRGAPAHRFRRRQDDQGHPRAPVRGPARHRLRDFEVTTIRASTSKPEGITDAVFHILRNANVIQPQRNPNLVVCWGGHSINRVEYNYSKHVGYQLGLRELDICTGCGPGAMKGPMKGATIGHAKQRLQGGRYLGISEPGIIAAESPNPIVNDLVIMPDIEKRLEAFVRTGHGIVVFPGGAGTAEEILYILGILLHPDNAEHAVPADLHRSGHGARILRADRPVHRPDPGRGAPRRATRSSSTTRTRWRARCRPGSARCANSARRAATPITSTGA